jgi:hypothetical protein
MAGLPKQPRSNQLMGPAGEKPRGGEAGYGSGILKRRYRNWNSKSPDVDATLHEFDAGMGHAIISREAALWEIAA